MKGFDTVDLLIIVGGAGFAAACFYAIPMFARLIQWAAGVIA